MILSYIVAYGRCTKQSRQMRTYKRALVIDGRLTSVHGPGGRLAMIKGERARQAWARDYCNKLYSYCLDWERDLLERHLKAEQESDAARRGG